MLSGIQWTPGLSSKCSYAPYWRDPLFARCIPAGTVIMSTFMAEVGYLAPWLIPVASMLLKCGESRVEITGRLRMTAWG